MFSSTRKAVVYCMSKLENLTSFVPQQVDKSKLEEDEKLLNELFAPERRLAHILTNAPESWINKVERAGRANALCVNPEEGILSSQRSQSVSEVDTVVDMNEYRTQSHSSLLAENYDVGVSARFHPTQYTDSGIYDYTRFKSYARTSQHLDDDFPHSHGTRQRRTRKPRNTRAQSDVICSVSPSKQFTDIEPIVIPNYEEVGQVVSISDAKQETYLPPQKIERMRSRTEL